MLKGLLTGALMLAAMVGGAQAQPATNMFSNVRLNGVALDSSTGRTIPSFVIASGDTLNLTLDYSVQGVKQLTFYIMAPGYGVPGDLVYYDTRSIEGVGSFSESLLFPVSPDYFSYAQVNIGIPFNSPSYTYLDGSGSFASGSFQFFVGTAVPGPLAGGGLPALLLLTAAWAALHRQGGDASA